jgi:anti-anti-sigma regulatory factor
MTDQARTSGDFIEVAEAPHTGYVRVHGSATYKLASALRDFVTRQLEAGRHGVLVDLGHCDTLDSTFIGTLTSLTLACRRSGKGCVKLFNLGSHLRDILATLGLTRILDVVEPTDMVEMSFGELAPARGDKVAVAQLMLEAHEMLAELNTHNALEFKNVIDYLRAKLN